MNLPPELMSQVLQHAVEVWPVYDLIRARCVSSFFNDEIVRHLPNSPELQGSGIVNYWFELPETVKRKILYQKIKDHPHRACVISSFHYEALKRHADGPEKNEIKEELTQAIVEAAMMAKRTPKVLLAPGYYEWQAPDDCKPLGGWSSTLIGTPFEYDLHMTRVFYAIKNQDHASLAALLQRGRCVFFHLSNLWGRRPVEVAADFADGEIIRIFYQYSQTENVWRKAFHYPNLVRTAVRHGNKDMLRFCLDDYVRLRTVDSGASGNVSELNLQLQDEALYMAVRLGKAEMVNMLMNASCELDKANVRFECLVEAIRFGQLSMVEHFLSLGGFDLGMRTGRSPKGLLFTAIQDCDPCVAQEVIETLLKNDVNPNTTNPAAWGTPLQEAVIREDPELTELLLAYGADPNLAGIPEESKARRRPPLFLAAAQGLWSVFDLLVNHGAHRSFTWKGKRYTIGSDRRSLDHITKVLVDLGWSQSTVEDAQIQCYMLPQSTPTRDIRKDPYVRRLVGTN
ncbi:ankyrin repeat-containing domain protein [Aspergillus avenaceus]|uniref:Ankyrin repeat-containing domain protein n=1 Tax=Aspergillus avenaceus TaxID=36643 RepID=A0A5N6U976_ASPAV|nr:ankyrin repeat-containing domain protein [Aspergillus avenaceus]